MKNVYNLSAANSLLTEWVNQLRCVNTQKDRLRFRRNLERIGEIGAYEISKLLDFDSQEIQSPLGSKSSYSLNPQPVVLTILRAGVPLFQGVMNYFDHADSGFVGSYRKHDPNEDFVIRQEYITCPAIKNRPLIITDPMIATGASLIEALKEILQLGEPSSVHILCAIAAKPGLKKVSEAFPDAKIWCGAIDEGLNDKNYIVPGLGDAGDLSFGSKLQS